MKEIVDPLENRNPKLWQDVSRRCFIIPKLFLTAIRMWPTKLKTKPMKIVLAINLVLMIHLEVAQLMYLALHPTDIQKFTLTVSTLSTTLQGITKMTLLAVNSHHLRTILDQCFFTFWPSGLMGTPLKRSLKSTSHFVQLNMICLTISAFIFAIGFLSKPLLDGTSKLPFVTWYPFNWTTPAIYTCVYLTQVVTNLLIVLCILGHDFIFLSLSTNIIAQFRLLSKAIDHLGSGRDAEWNRLLLPLEGIEKREFYPVEQQLLVKVVAHHNRLLLICDAMERIFSPTLFVQLATSMAAICVSSFLITAVDEIDTSLLYQLVSYCLGHVLQLYIICAAGSAIADQSQIIAKNAYCCYWYRQKYTAIRLSLILVIVRSQRAVRLTALKVFDMNYATFISVMRLSFSFYTLLTGIVEKN